MAGSVLQPEQIRHVVHVRDRDVHVSVVVEIDERRAAAGLRGGHRLAEPLADVREAAVAQVQIHHLPLLVAGFGLQLRDLGIHVSIGQKQIRPAVVVEIDPAGAPAEPARVDADAGGERAVLAESVARVRIQRRRVARKVRLEYVHRSVAIVVADRDAHAGLWLAVLAVGAAARDTDVGERAVAVVAVERARIGVVRDVQIGPAVVVEVERAHAEAVRAFRARDARALRDVLERAVAAIVIQRVPAAGESRRTAGDLDPFVAAETRLRRRRGGEVEIDVVGDEEVEPSVAIVVEERAAGSPARARVRQTRAPRDIFKRAVGAIVVQPVVSEVADEQIVVAVVVVVADARALPPAARRKPRFGCDVFERAVATVAIEMIGRRRRGRESFERRSIDEKQIQPAVVVVIDRRDTGAGGFEQVLVRVRAAIDDHPVETGRTRDVAEGKAERRRRFVNEREAAPNRRERKNDENGEGRRSDGGPDTDATHGCESGAFRCGASRSAACSSLRDSTSAPLRRSASAS